MSAIGMVFLVLFAAWMLGWFDGGSGRGHGGHGRRH